ncbi:hypothetical protein BC833DRAFT_354562 [Globomyces pollinis-pini]|nr:hypothetical protein BC833DRAFT_354562 [Globomyces pollinis-pini]
MMRPFFAVSVVSRIPALLCKMIPTPSDTDPIVIQKIWDTINSGWLVVKLLEVIIVFNHLLTSTRFLTFTS